MRSERLYLIDIYEAAKTVERFTVNVEKDAFLTDELLQSAVLHKLGIIGEAVNKLSIELKNRFPDVDWKAIVGTRNILVHVYFAVNLEVIWAAATEQMHPLQDQIRRILLTEFPGLKIEAD